MEKNYYRISQYARMKNVSYECVRQWIKAGKVRTEIIGDTKFVVEDGEETGGNTGKR